MTKQSACPDANSLLQLASGELPSSALDDLAQHLEGCSDCLAKVPTLVPADTVSTAFSHAGAVSVDADAGAVDALIARLKSIPAAEFSRDTAKTATSSSWAFLARPEAADELGRLGPYRVLEVVGQGGMGVVFKAEDPGLRRMVALKVMLPELAAISSAKVRFLREAQNAAAFKHDHIVRIYAVGEDRGAPWLAMEFLHGEPLDRRLRREGLLPLVDVLTIGRQTSLGLAAAHERGLIHRDIKPENIWLETKEDSAAPFVVKILDFGLARYLSDARLTQVGAIVGTPAYMAPEQAAGKSLDHRCDLFSLGAVLYRICTGEMAFKGADTLAILSSLANVKPAAPQKIEPGVPPELSDLIMALLAKEPDQRPGNAREVAARLQGMALDKPALSRPRHNRRYLLVGVVLVPLAACTVFYLSDLVAVKHPPVQPADPGARAALAVKRPHGHYALEFDGRTGYVDIPTLSRDEDRPITLEAYVSVGGTAGANLITMEGKCRCQLYGWPKKGNPMEWITNGADHRGLKLDAAATLTALQRNQRVHVAVQIDEVSLQMFVDGKKVNSMPRAPSPPNVGGWRGSVLGGNLNRNQNEPLHLFAGQLAEIRISGVARYADDFAPQTRFEPDDATLALYHCDEGEGDVLRDSSGHEHHGKIVGAKWVKAP